MNGLTPAWAGTALRLPSASMVPGAHPRVGGDGDQGVLHPCLAGGSPPRGRGRRTTPPRPFLRVGLTPAWAGTASQRPPSSPRSGAHPRVGGDGISNSTPSTTGPGSPPRGRGRQGVVSGAFRERGLTPAWAGTAHQASGRGSTSGAHPRVGGDGGQVSIGSAVPMGSPPRGRGRQPLIVLHDKGRGLTPAWAGTAKSRDRLAPWGWAHPRVGGDGWLGGFAAVDLGGSPPRGRGRLRMSPRCRRRSGLTPAWAGTATEIVGPDPYDRAHPRVGGDGSRDTCDGSEQPGSPPRGRGRHVPTGDELGHDGLTPAWAGTALPDKQKCARPPRIYFGLARLRRLATLQPGRMAG